MPFLLAEILNFQGSTQLFGVGSFSKVLSLLYGVMLGEDIVLFIHKTATDEPYGYIDITENSIFDVCMKGDKAPNKKVIDFVNRFAAAKGLRYDVKAHGLNDHK